MSDNTLARPTTPIATTPDTAEPADDQMYRFLATLFLIGIPILILFFIIMITLLAGAS